MAIKNKNIYINDGCISNYQSFFDRNCKDVARDLLGRLIVRATETGATGVKIISTGAYRGGNMFPSRMGMNYAPGTIFLMPWRGSYLFNITTELAEVPSCVEIREIGFHDHNITGSGVITKALQLDLEGVVLGREVQIIGKAVGYDKIKEIKGLSSNCLGYFKIK